MKKTNILLPGVLAILLILLVQPVYAHFGPRGLLGGSAHVGIQHNGIVYIGTEDAGVFESTNAQLTGWRLRAVGLKSGHITALAHSGAELYAASDSGVFIFNGFDGSDRFWNERNNGLGSKNVTALMATGANTLFAGTKANGLYKTTDKGVTWMAVNSSVLNGKDITALAMGGSRLFALVRNGGVFASDDNGANWFDLNDANTLNKTASEYFTYNSSTNELLVSNTDGLFILPSASSTVAPAYIAASNGLTGHTHIHGLTNNGSNWLAASHSGVLKTSASTINWSAVNTGLPGTNIGVVVAIDDTLVAGVAKSGMYKSDAGTISWVVNNTGMTNVNTYSIACKGDSLVATATEYGVTLSTNIGNNPVIINNGLTDSLFVNDVEFAGDLLFAATTNSGVFMTSNNGQSWTAQNTGLASMHISRIVYGSGRIYAIEDQGDVYESNLPTIAWKKIATGLPTGVHVTSLAFFANNMVAGTHGDGVFIKHRDSALWTSFNTGLANLNVTSVTYAAGKLYAGTEGSGVWVSDAKTAGWGAAANTVLSHFNNVPFLDASNIQYMTTVREYVIATFKGGVAGTTDGGATWVAGGNQFNLPSYTNIHKAGYVTSRIFVTTEANNTFSNAMAEFDYTDSLLVVNDMMVNATAAATESYHSITSNVKWKLASSASWVTMSADSGLWNSDIRLDIAPNTGQGRTATVTVTGDTMVRVITVNQQGAGNVATANAEQDDVKIYPNPNNGTFTLDLNGYRGVNSITITDVAGKVISEIPVENKNVLRVEKSLSPGVYFVQVHAAGGNIIKRVVVE